MERYRLKNIIILILTLLNVFLLGVLLARKSDEVSLLRRTEAELVALFDASGVTLEKDAISWDTPPAAVTLSRSDAAERSAAAFLVGGELRSAVQGGACSYSGSRGAVQFRSGGSFEAAGTLAAEDGMDFCRRFCKEFSCTEPVFVLDETLTGTATAVFRYEKRPVYNAAVTFRLEEGQVTAASGTLLSAETVTPTSESSKDLLSAAGALTAFQQMRQAESTVASSIQETYLCYELQSASLTLESAWCIVTDIASYYVNCSTGVITVG